MRLFTKDIDQKLFDQYIMGNDLENQVVVAKIFNPYGNGVWYLLNSDPADPDYLWAIVDLFEVEVGSVSREELETLKVPPFRLGLERDLYFTPMNAKQLYDSLLSGQKFEDGGTVDIKKDRNGDNWVFPNNPDEESYGIKLARGGMTVGRWYKDNSGKELRYVGESQGKLLFKDGENVVYKDESDFEDAPKERGLFDFFEHGGKTSGKRYKVNVYYGGEMEDEEFYTDSLKEAKKLSQGGEHSEIYDNHKKDFVEMEFAKGGEIERIGYEYIITDKNGNKYAIKNWAAQGYIIPYDGSKYWEHFKVPQENWIKIQDIDWSKFNMSKSDFDNHLDESNKKQSEILDKYKSSFAKGGGVGFTPYGETKGIYKIYYKADGKLQTEVWDTMEMAVNSAKRYSSPQMQGEFTDVKVYDEDGNSIDYLKMYEEGGDTDDGVDLFEDYDDIPENVKKVLDKHSEGFENGDYKHLEKAKKELEKIGYTFEYGLDGEAYDLRKIGQKGKNDDEYAKGGELMKHKHLEYVTIELIEPTSKGWKVKQIETHSVRGRKLSTPKEKVAYFSKEEIKDLFEPMMAKGGRTKFKDKVQSIKASLLKRKKVSPKVQKDYGKTYSPKEAEESAKRIVGAMVKKEKRKPRVSKVLEKMKKGTEIKKKKSTFKDRMKELSNKIKETKNKSKK